MSRADPRVVAALWEVIAPELNRNPLRPVVIGLCGAQGSGKSTLARAVVERCEAKSIAAATLSLDDLYLTRAEREALGRQVHPLLATRGPPGTHDVALGMQVVASLRRGEPVALPRFDKASDDRAPVAQWPAAPARCEILLFEGWCVGAVPQGEAELHDPLNALEAVEDPDRTWRTYVNAALAGPYRELFALIDRLVLLAAPGFEVVYEWRLEQEQELAEISGNRSANLMDEAGIASFILHYERLTRHILAEMPDRADVLVRLDEQRQPLEIRVKPSR